MKKILFLIILPAFFACKGKSDKTGSTTMISTESEQKLVFDGLMRVTDSLISKEVRSDSLSFLVLPLEASCPSCRKKIIDSIIARKNNLRENHYIIISTTEGYNTINAYFTDRKGTLPVIKGKLFLDSTNYASNLELYTTKPVFYYTYKEKAYKKVEAIPMTVKEDCREFFSGQRQLKSYAKK